MTTRKTTCSCEKVKLETKEETLGVSVCHCKACQKRTGSAFGVQATFNSSEVNVIGETKTFSRIGDEGIKIDFDFCTNCGDKIFYKINVDMFKDKIIIPVGLFADSNFPQPKMSVYELRKYPWFEFTCELKHID